MTSRRRLAAWPLVLMLAGMLGACAVARIDVDVYKGPLADHEQVQVQEFVVLAIGAKPLVVQLRDRLQWQNETVRECVRGQEWYAAKFIEEPTAADCPVGPDCKACPKTSECQPCTGEGCSRVCKIDNIWNESAARVNAVLQLYEDQDLKGLEPYIERGQEDVSRYRTALDVFYSPLNKTAWAEAEPEFVDTDNPETAKKELAKRFTIPKGAVTDTLIDSYEALTLAYKKYLGVPLTGEQIGRASDLLYGLAVTTGECAETTDKSDCFDHLGRAETVELAYQRLFLEIEGFSTDQTTIADYRRGLLDSVDPKMRLNSSNFLFGQLRTPSVLRSQMEALFGDPDRDVAVRFGERVTAIAEAFQDSRDADRDLWLASLDTLEFTENSLRLSSTERAKMRDSLAETISFLTQSWHLAQVFYQANSPPDEMQKFKELLESLAPGAWIDAEAAITSQGQAQDSSSVKPREFTEIRSAARSIRMAVADERYTLKVIGWLRFADKWFRNTPPEEFHGAPEFRSLVKRQYGLARGPTLSPDKLEELLDRWSNVETAASGVGFEHGRLPKGLEKLIEEYLIVSSDPSNEPDSPAVREARERLLEALVRFSKKVLFIADNTRLIDDKVIGNKTTGLTDEQKRQRRARNSYIRVLQAVGNSIRIQADELTHQQAHDEELKHREASERRAFAAALARSNERAFDFFQTEAQKTLTASETALAAAEADVTTAGATIEFIEAQLSAGAVTHAVSDAEKAKAPEKSDEQVKSAVTAMLPRWSAMILLKGVGEARTDDPTRFATAVTDAAGAQSDMMIDGATARQTIVTFADVEIADYLPALPDDPRLKLLQSARIYFADQATGLDTIPRKSGTDAFNDIKARVIGKWDEVKDTLAEQLDEATRLARVATEAQTRAEMQRDQAQAILAILDEYRAAILARASAENAGGDYEGFRDTAVAVLAAAEDEAQKAAQQDNSKQPRADQLTDAKQWIAALRLPSQPGATDLALDTKRDSSEDVLDDMIALLRYELLVELKEHGQASPQAQYLAEALASAYEQRAGMAYIRPAGAYLRSSFLATTLQDDPSLDWENMLGEHGLRTTPLVGPIYNSIVDDAETAEINAEIDKQFWQTINRVRVAGAGITNYVIAKDDIGNWYVKKYSADSKPIINSAKNLALFGLGGQFDSNLIAEVQKQETTSADGATGEAATGEGEAAAAAATEPSTPMERLLDKHATQYETATKNDYDALKKLVDNPKESAVTTSIKAAWTANADTKKRLDQLTPVLDAAAEESFGAAKKKLDELAAAAKRSERAANIVAALSEIVTFYPALRSMVMGLPIIKEAEADLKTKQQARKEAETKLKEGESKLEAAQHTLTDRQGKKRAAEDAWKGAGSPTSGTEKTNLDQATDAETQAESHVTDLTTEVERLKTALSTAQKNETDAEKTLQSAQRAETTAVAEAARILRKHLKTFTDRRTAAVKEYESAVVFIGDANNPTTQDGKKADGK